MVRIFTILILCLLMLPLRVMGMEIDGYSPDKHDRYASDDSFIAASSDLSGVAISSDGRWATLIAPNVFITAAHFPPAAGQTVTFYSTHDPAGASVTRTVGSVRQKIGTSDLFVGTLTEPVPEGFRTYSRVTQGLPLISAFYPYLNETMFVVGRSPGDYSTELDMAVGRNVLDVLKRNVTAASSTGPAVEVTRNVSGEPNYVDDETAAQGGDSGGPLFFAEGSGNLLLVGIAWYRLTTLPGGTGFTPVGDYTTEVNSFLSTNGLPYQPLPPESLQLIRQDATTVELRWSDVSQVETAYIVERATTIGGPWTGIALLSADQESFLDSAVPEGDVLYRVRAGNDSFSPWVEVSDLTPYGVWASGFDWDGADSSDQGDANGDGLQNRVAYALAFSPLEDAPEEALPNLSVADGVVDLLYHRNPDATDVEFQVQRKEDLAATIWSPVVPDGVTVTETDLGPVGDARLIRVRFQEGTLNADTFFRLSLSR